MTESPKEVHPIGGFMDNRFRLTNHMVGGVGPAPGFDSWLFPGEPRRRR